MARYIVRKTISYPIERYRTYETEIEVEDGVDVHEAMPKLSSRKWGNYVDEWDEPGFGSEDERYEVIEELDKAPEVQGKPEDFGLKQAPLL